MVKQVGARKSRKLSPPWGLKGQGGGVAFGIWQELKLKEKGCLARAVNLGAEAGGWDHHQTVT